MNPQPAPSLDQVIQKVAEQCRRARRALVVVMQSRVRVEVSRENDDRMGCELRCPVQRSEVVFGMDERSDAARSCDRQTVPTWFESRVWCAIGSSNFDDRSFETNDEIMLSFADAALAERLDQIFEKYAPRCTEIELEACRRRGLGHRLKDNLAYMLNEVL